MKQILLSNTLNTLCALRKAVRVKLGKYPFYPDVNRKSLHSSEAVKQSALGNLFANSLNFQKLLPRLIKGCGFYFFKINLTAGYLPCRVKYVLIAKARSQRRKLLLAQSGKPFAGGKGKVAFSNLLAER